MNIASPFFNFQSLVTKDLKENFTGFFEKHSCVVFCSFLLSYFKPHALCSVFCNTTTNSSFRVHEKHPSLNPNLRPLCSCVIVGDAVRTQGWIREARRWSQATGAGTRWEGLRMWVVEESLPRGRELLASSTKQRFLIVYMKTNPNDQTQLTFFF